MCSIEATLAIRTIMIAKKEKISALIITYNEIGYIEKCLESVSFADEILVVDSFSTDGTYEYLLDHPKAEVIQNPFENFTAQKSFALKKASNDWILFLDADEEITVSLEKEILKTVNSKNGMDAYRFYRKFMYQNNPLHFSGWQTDKNYRLFKKSKARFTEDRIVHETLQIDGTSATLSERLVHYCYKNYKDYKSKMLHYGRLRAQEEYRKGNQFSYLKLIVKPTWKFFYNYIIRFGFLDAQRGITICYLDALSVLKRFYELRKLEREELRPVFSNFPKQPKFALSKNQLAS